MHRAFYDVGPLSDSPSTPWVGASDTKKSRKSWGERLRLGVGSKEDRGREKEMALDLLQNKYYMQERYGPPSATILQEASPMMFTGHPWPGYGSIAVRHPQLLLRHPPIRSPAFEEDTLRPPSGPRVLCPCGGGSEKSPRSRKKGTFRSKGCGLCGGGGTVRLATKGEAKEGTVRGGGTVVKDGTIQLKESVRRGPTLEGLFAASTAGAATVRSSKTTESSKVDPYDVMRRSRLARPAEFGSVRIRSKSSSPNRGRRNRKKLWGAREWPSEGEDDSAEEGGWEEEDGDRDEGGGRKSILECEVSAYELLTKYLKKGEGKEEDKEATKDELLSMDDDLSDGLSDNALEEEETKRKRDRKVQGGRSVTVRDLPQATEEAKPTRPPRRSRTPVKDSRSVNSITSVTPPVPPPLPPPLPPKRFDVEFLPQSAIKSILKKTVTTVVVPEPEPSTSVSTSEPPEECLQEVLRKKESAKKQVQFKATHDVVTVPPLMEDEEQKKEVEDNAEGDEAHLEEEEMKEELDVEQEEEVEVPSESSTNIIIKMPVDEDSIAEESKEESMDSPLPVMRKVQSEILIGSQNADLCRTNTLRHSLDDGRENAGEKQAPLFNDTMRLRLKVHRPQARRAFQSPAVPRQRMLSPPPRPREPPPPPPSSEKKEENTEETRPSPPPAPPRQIFPFTPDEIARINGEGRRWNKERPPRPMSWTPSRDLSAVTVSLGGVEEVAREGKKVSTVVTLGGWQDKAEHEEAWRVLVEPKKTSILISGEAQVINRRDDNTLTISVAGGGSGVAPCGVYVAPKEGEDDEAEITRTKCFLQDPVEAVRRNLIPHVCGKSEEVKVVEKKNEEEEKNTEEKKNAEEEKNSDEELVEEVVEEREEGEVASEGTVEDTLVGSVGEEVKEEEDEEDDHYEVVGEPIYEEIGEGKEEKSIFEGASKYDILSYLVGARARGIPMDSEFDSLGLEDDLMEDFEEEDEEEDLVIPLSLRNVGCRASHLSDSSEDSRATPSPLTSLALADKRRSSAEIERNDSGVGSETSKSSRSRWQPPSSSSSASTCSSSNALAEEKEAEEGLTDVCNQERHLCEDCDQPVETQVTDGGLRFAPLVCRKCGKRRSERREIIAEIVETEAKYGRDLRILLEEFERPMRVAGLLSVDQLSGIFLNTEELATASSALVSRLRDALEIAIESGDEDLLTVNVGKVFLDAAPTMLHAFQSYCTRQGAASLLLSNLEKEKELLRVFLRVSQMENAVLRRMNLNSFLMVPVQRVTKYPLLLGRLFKVTPPHAEGRDMIRQAQRKIELHLEHMNAETKDMSTIRLWRRISIMNGTPFRRSNSETDMQNIRLKKMALDVLEWNPDEVRFPVEGKLLYAQPTDSKWRKGQTVKLTPINALLVTQGKLKSSDQSELAEKMLMFPRDTGIKEAALLIVKEKCSRYTLLREPLFLDRCIICKEMDWDDCFEVQELSTKDTYVFKGNNTEVTRQWYHELQYHALGLGPWRKRRNALANIMINSMARTTS